MMNKGLCLKAVPVGDFWQIRGHVQLVNLGKN
jgi:hypothetical protein